VKGTAIQSRTDNTGRRAKVPILLINATALNNGHNWRFEASTMGEPELIEVSDVVSSIRLRRHLVAHDQAPTGCQLGLAVLRLCSRHLQLASAISIRISGKLVQACMTIKAFSADRSR
jgi:hypothetical protein